MNNSVKAKRRRIRVLNLFPDISSPERVVSTVAELVGRGKGGYVCVSTVHMVMESYDDKEFCNKVNSANFVVTDGMPLVWFQKLKGAKDAERVRGNDLMILLLSFAENEKIKVGFYGGMPEVMNKLIGRAKKDFPELKVVYSDSPPFRELTPEEDDKIVENINNSAAQILFVGLGCPRQENWMVEHRERLSAVMLGVGAAFDFYAGDLKEAPRWMGKLGLEWLFRLRQEPRRLWRRYLILNPRFIWLASLQLLRLKKFE